MLTWKLKRSPSNTAVLFVGPIVSGQAAASWSIHDPKAKAQYVYIYIHYIYNIRTCVYTHTCYIINTYAHVYVHLYIYICIDRHTYMYICMFIYTYMLYIKKLIDVYIYMYICIHTSSNHTGSPTSQSGVFQGPSRAAPQAAPCHSSASPPPGSAHEPGPPRLPLWGLLG